MRLRTGNQRHHGDARSLRGRPSCCWGNIVANPSNKHLVAAKRVVKYLKGTIDMSLSASKTSNGQMLTGWTDSDWAGS